MLKSLTNAKFPKPVRIALAALCVYGGAVTIVNLAPEQFEYVPVLSDVTPVLAEVTQMGVTRTQVVSHAEFTRINEVREQVLSAVEELETELNNVMSELETNLAELERELTESVELIAHPWEADALCTDDFLGGRFCYDWLSDGPAGDNWRISWTSQDRRDREEILVTCDGKELGVWSSEGTLSYEDVEYVAEQFCAV
ncbi:hypothetical protein SCREM2_gp96 [Synechococcus phage S-CREM2]|nr:hypothetical protein SCREM2_gp96 [Synechococcus phage S-CREM2]